MSWGVQLIACFFATFTFSVLMNAPRNIMLLSALIATVGYGVFLLLGGSVLAYFAASMLIGLSCEIFARIFKRAATLFFTSAIIPLVPGVGLYNTMRYVVEGNYSKAMNTGVTTLLAICGIALAVTISSVLFGAFAHRRKRETS